MDEILKKDAMNGVVDEKLANANVQRAIPGVYS